jgi:hypothetical protein
MSGGYDDRDGKIWFDGNFVDWRDANVHVLTHAMHYASSVNALIMVKFLKVWNIRKDLRSQPI